MTNDALSIIAAHKLAGTRREFVDALMRFGWSEEDAEDAATRESDAFEAAEGEPLWPTRQQQIAATQRQTREDLSVYRSQTLCA